MKNTIFIFLAATVLSATSCNNWLDVQPRTQESAKEIFETLEGYQSVLTGCYIKLKSSNLYGRDMTVTLTEYLAQHWDVDESQDSQLYNLSQAVKAYDYEAENVKDAFREIFAKMYNVIVQVNTILEALPQTGKQAIELDRMRGVIEGEALAMRAYCHFDILRLFGEVPGGSIKVKLPYSEKLSYQSAEYYSFEDFAGKIESDLKKAEKLLEEHDPFTYFNVDQVNGIRGNPQEEIDFFKYRQLRLNYYAVKALQARFYLYIGNRDNDALEAARSVIKTATDGKGFALAGSDNFNSKYYALPGEGLFMLTSHQIKNTMSGLFPGYADNNRVGLYMSLEKLEEMFGGSSTVGASNRYKNVWNLNKENSLQEICPELLKYYQGDDEGMSATYLMLYKQLIPMLRLSELYLIVMELSNDPAELDAFYFAYRRARDMPEDTFTTEQIKAVVEAEYRREFFGEGQMFFYYKRNFAPRMMWSDKTVTEINYIVPIPETELDPTLN